MAALTFHHLWTIESNAAVNASGELIDGRSLPTVSSIDGPARSNRARRCGQIFPDSDDVRVELVAAEPLVASPCALAFDAGAGSSWRKIVVIEHGKSLRRGHCDARRYQWGWTHGQADRFATA